MRRAVRAAGWLLLVSASAGLLRAAPAPANLVKDPFEGSWTVLSYKVGGSEMFMLTEDEKPVFVFKGGTVTMKIPKVERVLKTYTYKLDRSQRPEAVDLTEVDGAKKGATRLGIFSVKDDNAKLCWSLSPDDARPAEFTSAKGKRTTLVILKKRDQPLETKK